MSRWRINCGRKLDVLFSGLASLKFGWILVFWFWILKTFNSSRWIAVVVVVIVMSLCYILTECVIPFAVTPSTLCKPFFLSSPLAGAVVAAVIIVVVVIAVVEPFLIPYPPFCSKIRWRIAKRSKLASRYEPPIPSWCCAERQSHDTT